MTVSGPSPGCSTPTLTEGVTAVNNVDTMTNIRKASDDRYPGT
jgi:hypothetical protein